MMIIVLNYEVSQVYCYSIQVRFKAPHGWCPIWGAYLCWTIPRYEGARSGYFWTIPS